MQRSLFPTDITRSHPTLPCGGAAKGDRVPQTSVRRRNTRGDHERPDGSIAHAQVKIRRLARHDRGGKRMQSNAIDALSLCSNVDSVYQRAIKGGGQS